MEKKSIKELIITILIYITILIIKSSFNNKGNNKKQEEVINIQKNNITKEINKNKEKYNISVCLCLIAKNQKRYINEFVSYHLNLGVDKIFIYDNNDVDNKKENFEILLNKEVKNGNVEIFNIRGRADKMKSFRICYENYNKTYDWFVFIDSDEFVILKKQSNLKAFLLEEQFNKCDTIRLNWLVAGDNDLLYYDNRSIFERFKKFEYDNFENRWVKSLVRGKLDGNKTIIMDNPHAPAGKNFKACNSKGEIGSGTPYNNNYHNSHDIAYVAHFWSKSLTEFCLKARLGEKYWYQDRINLYFTISKRTKEKEDLLKKCLKEDYFVNEFFK